MRVQDWCWVLRRVPLHQVTDAPRTSSQDYTTMCFYCPQNESLSSASGFGVWMLVQRFLLSYKIALFQGNGSFKTAGRWKVQRYARWRGLRGASRGREKWEGNVLTNSESILLRPSRIAQQKLISQHFNPPKISLLASPSAHQQHMETWLSTSWLGILQSLEVPP